MFNIIWQGGSENVASDLIELESSTKNTILYKIVLKWKTKTTALALTTSENFLTERARKQTEESIVQTNQPNIRLSFSIKKRGNCKKKGVELIRIRSFLVSEIPAEQERKKFPSLHKRTIKNHNEENENENANKKSTERKETLLWWWWWWWLLHSSWTGWIIKHWRSKGKL